jgi:hypothetical protein
MSTAWIAVPAASLTLLVAGCSSDDGDGGDPGPDAAVIAQSAACARYIDCLQRVAPDDVTEALVSFGESSACWDSAGQAAECTADCIAGLNLQHESNPDVLACAECEIDEDCSRADTPYCGSRGECQRFECSIPDDCSGDEVCKDTDSGERACGPCENDEDCSLDEICIDAGTPSARCRECENDDDCPDGFVCDEVNEVCDFP